MFNFFKKKPKIRFINVLPGVAPAYPIYSARELKRDWLERNAKDFNTETKRVKKCPIHEFSFRGLGFMINCPAIKEFMNTGYIVPCPFDFAVDTNGDGVTFQASTLSPADAGMQFRPDHDNIIATNALQSHSKAQFHDYVKVPRNSLKTVLKINTGWNIVPDDNFVYMFSSVHYNEEDRFTAAAGILDPYISPAINVQLYWHVLQGREIIKAGTPLLQIIPIPRNALQPEHSCEVLNAVDVNKVMSLSFLNRLTLKPNYNKTREAGKLAMKMPGNEF